MELKIQYFASVREAMAREEETVQPPEGVETVADLVQYLSSQDASFAELAGAENPDLQRRTESVARYEAADDAAD